MRITKRKLTKLSNGQLQVIIDECEKLLEDRLHVEKVKQEAMELLAKYGLTTDDLIESRKTTRKVAAKYKHKTDPNLTWSGRGRTPKWIKKHGVKVA